MSSINQQLTLGLRLLDDATFDNFQIGQNREIIKTLQQCITKKTDLHASHREAFIYLWGPRGTGTSHLLQACCHTAFQNGCPMIFLRLSEPGLNPDVLHDLEHMDVICLDDIEAVLKKPDWEEALLHLYNRARDHQTCLIVASHQAPQQLKCHLPDLHSRLTWGLSLCLQPLSDEEKRQALQKRAAQRGLVFSDRAAEFLMRYYSRDTRALFECLETLDQASLVEQRKLTIPFIKKTLKVREETAP